MQINELRIRNFVYSKSLEQYVQIGYISSPVGVGYLRGNTSAIDSCGCLSDIEPIKLTEESFIKCGAIKDENDDLYVQHPRNEQLRFYLVAGFIQLTVGDCCPMSNYNHIDKVHLFQNLYFFETGEELELTNFIQTDSKFQNNLEYKELLFIFAEEN